MHELSNIEIDNYFKTNPYYGGCMAKDEFKIKPNKFFIINMDNHTGEGTHWILCSNLNPRYCFFFDPFGAPMPEEVLYQMKKTKKKCFYSDVDLQALDSSSCGYFCCYFASQLCKGRSPVDILYDDFDPRFPNSNEKTIKKKFRK